MGIFQLIIVITGVMIIKNHFLEKDKRKPKVVRTIFEIIVVVLIIVTLESIFPFLRN